MLWTSFIAYTTDLLGNMGKFDNSDQELGSIADPHPVMKLPRPGGQ